MDSLTHALSGLLLNRLLPTETTGVPENSEYLPVVQKAKIITILAASELPDLDVIAGLPGKLNYLLYHRGPSHSIIGLLLISILLAGIMKLFYPQVKTSRLIGWAMLAGILHIALDLLTAYGTQVLYPWDQTRYAYDILMIVDPFLLVLLIAGLAGARWLKPWIGTSRIARVTALLAVVYIGGRMGIHSSLMDQVDRYIAGEIKPVSYRASVLPPLIGLREWDIVIDTPDEYLLGSAALGKEPQIKKRVKKPEQRPEIKAALATQPAGVFLKFARYPHVIESFNEDGYRVQIVDLRYYNNGRIPFSIRLDLSRDLRLVDYALGDQTESFML